MYLTLKSWYDTRKTFRVKPKLCRRYKNLKYDLGSLTLGHYRYKLFTRRLRRYRGLLTFLNVRNHNF